MIIRIFYEHKVNDISIDSINDFSIGSDPHDSMYIADAKLSGHHVSFRREGETVTIAPLGNVYRSGELITKELLIPDAVYSIGDDHTISFIGINMERSTLIGLPMGGSITIGRKDDNTICVDSPLLSRAHARIDIEYRHSYNLDGRDSEQYMYTITDLGSLNGTYIDSVKISRQIFTDGTIIMGDLTLHFDSTGLLVIYCGTHSIHTKLGQMFSETKRTHDTADTNEPTLFERSPRLKSIVPNTTINIEAPPRLGGKPEINWLSTFLPMVVTIGIAVVMTIIGNSMMLVYTLPMTLAGVIVSITNYLRQKKKYKEQDSLRSQKYTEHLSACISEIESAQKEQLSILNSNDPDIQKCLGIAFEKNRRLWERRPTDTDFVSVRLGSGDVATAAEIKYPKSTLTLEEDELINRPAEIYEEHKVIHNAPITCDILHNQVCGIVGNHSDAIHLLNNLVISLTALHCYTEVKLVPIFDSRDNKELEWITSLPHVMDNSRTVSYVAQTTTEVVRITDSIGADLKKRKLDLTSSNSYGENPFFLPYYLFVLAQPTLLNKDNSINDYLLRTHGINAGILFLANNITQLPKECNLIIEINGTKGRRYNKDNSNLSQSFVIDSSSQKDFESFSQSLKQLYCEEDNVTASLPNNLPFFRMLGVDDISNYSIEKAWKSSNVTKSLAAPIGLTENNNLLSLDIHETAHGPHGLVAGTTGSGKSEVLQSFILSLALKYHPNDVGFVIIDFKGGGMSNQFINLPHLLGSITDLDDAQINRSLAFIEAELDKRKRLFAEARVKDIDNYIQKYKSGSISTPLPHLIIIVDEFAELKAEQPDFMKALISTSRIGRSLGIHLILATQKPSGQVNDQIWSNSRFRICLKVATKEDSQEMLKSPAAFSISGPGRAYLQVGNNEVFELFQSGYSGEKVSTLNGRTTTQLQKTIQYISDYCRSRNINRLPPICLAPLDKRIHIDSSISLRDNQIPIGVYDDPESQSQGTFFLDCFRKNTMIIGSSQSGKTTLLQTIIKEVAMHYSPEEANIYIIDFASMVLKAFNDLPHVGGVVTSLQEEKLFNLFKLLNTEIQKRKQVFLKMGISSFTAYREAGQNELPQIIVIVDNVAALRELYFQDDDLLLPICQYGLTYGISVVIANLHTSGLGYKYLSNFANRIALNCNEYSEYVSLFDKCKLSIEELQGRCIVEQEKKLYECQIFYPFDGEKEIQHAEEIKAFIQDSTQKYPKHRAFTIPEIPEVLTTADLLKISKGSKIRGQLILGLNHADVSPLFLRFNSLGILGITGGTQDNRDSLIGQLIDTVNGNVNGFQLYIIDSVNRRLSSHKDKASVKEYTYIPQKAGDIIQEIHSICQERYSRLLSGVTVDFTCEDVILAIINSNDAIAQICDSPEVNNKYHEIINKYKNMNVCFVISCFENHTVAYNAPDIIKDAKDARHFVFLDDIQKIKFMDIPYSDMKANKKSISNGDCFFINDTDIIRVKTTVNN